MKAVIQRVSKATVLVDGKIVSSIGKGLVVLLGIHKTDTPEDSDWMIRKLLGVRIFDNAEGKLAHSIEDIQGGMLAVSQITLYGDMSKGKRPDFTNGMPPKEAKPFYHEFVSRLQAAAKVSVKEGEFGAMMDVDLINSGPVTLILDSHNR